MPNVVVLVVKALGRCSRHEGGALMSRVSASLKRLQREIATPSTTEDTVRRFL